MATSENQKTISLMSTANALPLNAKKESSPAAALDAFPNTELNLSLDAPVDASSSGSVDGLPAARPDTFYDPAVQPSASADFSATADTASFQNAVSDSDTLNACSATDCTGLIPALPSSDEELENYENMYAFCQRSSTAYSRGQSPAGEN